MIRAWQKRLLRSRKGYIKDFDNAGTFQHVFEPGIYEITLIGGGGGGTSVKFSSTNATSVCDGGVGGVLKARIKVLTDTTATIQVGKGGDSKSKYSTGYVANYTPADNGQVSKITGLSNVSLVAGAGTGAIGQNDTVGTQGQNTYSGSNIISILENNTQTIISRKHTTNANTRIGNPVYNVNFAEDENKGCGGTVNWEGSKATPINGGVGFVRIETIE